MFLTITEVFNIVLKAYLFSKIIRNTFAVFKTGVSKLRKPEK